MAHIIVLVILAVVGILLSVLDVVSTKAAFKNGANEANPIMAWFQRRFPTNWPYIRVGLAVLLFAAAFFAPWPVSAIGMFIVDVVYGVVVRSNFKLAADK